MENGIIYIAVNIINGKLYVGYTTNFNDRLSKHRYCAKKNSAFHFHNAIRKYGFDKFRFVILTYPKSLLKEKEKLWIQRLGCKEPYGYNMTDGGDGTLNMSQESKNKIAGSRRGMKFTEEHKMHLKESHKGMLGKHHSKETKEKIGIKNSIKLKGKKLSENVKKKISDSLLKGEESPFSKWYIFTDEFQNKYRIKGLRNFCKEHDLTISTMCSICKTGGSHRGWKARREE